MFLPASKPTATVLVQLPLPYKVRKPIATLEALPFPLTIAWYPIATLLFGDELAAAAPAPMYTLFSPVIAAIPCPIITLSAPLVKAAPVVLSPIMTFIAPSTVFRISTSPFSLLNFN